MTTPRTIKVGVVTVHIRCRKYHTRKKSCDVECDFICQLNNGGSKDVRSSIEISREFHVTANQLKCALHDGIIHAETFQHGSKLHTFVLRNEVAEKLDAIRTYPKKSAAEVERDKKYSRPIYEKNNIIAAEGSSDDLCTIAKACNEFGVDVSKLYCALEFGIIHSQVKDGRTKYLLSKTEIQKNLDLIKKSSRIFYRLLKVKPSQERQIEIESQQMNANVPLNVDSGNLPQKCQEITA